MRHLQIMQCVAVYLSTLLIHKFVLIRFFSSVFETWLGWRVICRGWRSYSLFNYWDFACHPPPPLTRKITSIGLLSYCMVVLSCQVCVQVSAFLYLGYLHILSGLRWNGNMHGGHECVNVMDYKYHGFCFHYVRLACILYKEKMIENFFVIDCTISCEMAPSCQQKLNDVKRRCNYLEVKEDFEFGRV